MKDVTLGKGKFKAEILDEWWEDYKLTWTKEEFLRFDRNVQKSDKVYQFHWSCTQQAWVGPETPADPLVFKTQPYTIGGRPGAKRIQEKTRKYLDKIKKYMDVADDIDVLKKIRAKFGASKMTLKQLNDVIKNDLNFDCLVRVKVEYIRIRLRVPGETRYQLFVVSVPHHVRIAVFKLAKCKGDGKVVLGKVAREVPAFVEEIELDKQRKISEEAAKELTEREIAELEEATKEMKEELERLKKRLKKMKAKEAGKEGGSKKSEKD